MWADVFADTPARRQIRGSSNRGALYIYRLRDEPRAIILVACTKCGWKGVQRRRNLSPCTVLIAPFRPARSCRSGLLKDRLELGPLRRAFFRAHRRTAMTTHPAPFQGRFYRDPRSPRSHSPDGVYAQPKSKTPPSRKVWPRFEEVVPCAEPRHGRGPEGGVPLNSGVGALGGKGNTRCSRLQRTNHPAVPKQHAAWHTDGAAARNGARPAGTLVTAIRLSRPFVRHSAEAYARRSRRLRSQNGT